MQTKVDNRKATNTAQVIAGLEKAINYSVNAVKLYHSAAFDVVTNFAATAIRAMIAFNLERDQALGRSSKPFEANQENMAYVAFLQNMKASVQEARLKKWRRAASDVIEAFQNDEPGFLEKVALAKPEDAPNMVRDKIKAIRGWTTQDEILKATTKPGQSGRKATSPAGKEGEGDNSQSETEGKRVETDPAKVAEGVAANLLNGAFDAQSIWVILNAATQAWAKVPADQQEAVKAKAEKAVADVAALEQNAKAAKAAKAKRKAA